MRKRVGNNSFRLWRVRVADHRVGLARARLPVSQDGSIVSLEYFVDDRPSCVDIQVDLEAAKENEIKCEAVEMLMSIM